LGVNLLLQGPKGSFYFQTEIFSRLNRSVKVNDGIAFAPLSYQKRFDHYYDAITFGIRAGIRWRPKISERAYLDMSLLPELFYYEFPNKRQSDQLNIYQVRYTVMDKDVKNGDKYSANIVINLGLSFLF
jgi:hypothetical protein